METKRKIPLMERIGRTLYVASMAAIPSSGIVYFYGNITAPGEMHSPTAYIGLGGISSGLVGMLVGACLFSRSARRRLREEADRLGVERDDVPLCTRFLNHPEALTQREITYLSTRYGTKFIRDLNNSDCVRDERQK